MQRKIQNHMDSTVQTASLGNMPIPKIVTNTTCVCLQKSMHPIISSQFSVRNGLPSIQTQNRAQKRQFRDATAIHFPNPHQQSIASQRCVSVNDAVVIITTFATEIKYLRWFVQMSSSIITNVDVACQPISSNVTEILMQRLVLVIICAFFNDFLWKVFFVLYGFYVIFEYIYLNETTLWILNRIIFVCGNNWVNTDKPKGEISNFQKNFDCLLSSKNQLQKTKPENSHNLVPRVFLWLNIIIQ